jgi:phosphatidylserine decarboxylase
VRIALDCILYQALITNCAVHRAIDLLTTGRFMTRLFILLQYLIPQHLLSRCIGYVARSEIPWLKNFVIKQFDGIYKIDWAVAIRKDPEQYVSFNDFFTRALIKEARPLTGRLVSPADGLVSVTGDIKQQRAIQAKGHDYSIPQLLGEALPESFNNGSFLTVYLAPSDYHRVHFPQQGALQTARYIPGALFSVNQATATHVPGLFTRNERLVLRITSSAGDYYLVLIGAMIVAGIQPFWDSEPFKAQQPIDRSMQARAVDKGQEAGRFLLGSTAILITQANQNWCVTPGSTIKMGQTLVN